MDAAAESMAVLFGASLDLSAAFPTWLRASRSSFTVELRSSSAAVSDEQCVDASQLGVGHGLGARIAPHVERDGRRRRSASFR